MEKAEMVEIIKTSWSGKREREIFHKENEFNFCPYCGSYNTIWRDTMDDYYDGGGFQCSNCTSVYILTSYPESHYSYLQQLLEE